MAKPYGKTRYLYVIEQFAISVARSIIGGTVTRANHSLGDIYLEDSDTFFEVKASGLSSGPIVEKTQMLRHFKDLENHDHYYVFVLYQNRSYVPKTRSWRYLAKRAGKTDATLRKFLAGHTSEVWIVHVSVIRNLFIKRRREVKRYLMARGPKTYLKIYPGVLRGLFDKPDQLAALGLAPESYQFRSSVWIGTLDGQKIAARIYRIELFTGESWPEVH